MAGIPKVETGGDIALHQRVFVKKTLLDSFPEEAFKFEAYW